MCSLWLQNATSPKILGNCNNIDIIRDYVFWMQRSFNSGSDILAETPAGLEQSISVCPQIAC